MIAKSSIVSAIVPLLLALPACGPGDNGDDGGGQPSPWAGKTFTLPIGQRDWTDPPNVGADVADVFGGFLIGIGPNSANTLDVTLAPLRGGVQDTCSPTATLSASGTGYPNVSITAAELPMRLVSSGPDTMPNTADDLATTAKIRNLALTNVLPGQTTKIGTLEAVLDAREVYSIFWRVNGTADDVCAQLGSVGATCSACPQDGANYCLKLVADFLGATEAAAPIQTVAQACP